MYHDGWSVEEFIKYVKKISTLHTANVPEKLINIYNIMIMSKLTSSIYKINMNNVCVNKKKTDKDIMYKFNENVICDEILTISLIFS